MKRYILMVAVSAVLAGCTQTEPASTTSTTTTPPASAKQAEAPKATEAKPESVAVTAPAKPEAPAVDAPKADMPKVDAPKADAPKVDAPKVDAVKPEMPKTIDPKAAEKPAPPAVPAVVVGDRKLKGYFEAKADGKTYVAESLDAITKASAGQPDGTWATPWTDINGKTVLFQDDSNGLAAALKKEYEKSHPKMER